MLKGILEHDHMQIGSSCGEVVKLLACEARNMASDSRSHRYDFIDWLSPVSESLYG